MSNWVFAVHLVWHPLRHFAQIDSFRRVFRVGVQVLVVDGHAPVRVCSVIPGGDLIPKSVEAHIALRR